MQNITDLSLSITAMGRTIQSLQTISSDSTSAAQARKPPVLAIIMPCFNEQEALTNSLNRILEIRDHLLEKGSIDPSSYLACVDDGSCDATWNVISAYAEKTSGVVKGLKLSRNFGHQNALIAGLLTFAFDVAVTIDADLQDPPEVIRDMVAKYNEGFDIVYGVRDDRSSDTFMKRTTAQMYYRFMQALRVDLVYNHADFRLLSRRVVQALSEFGEYHLFLRGIIPYLGFQSTVVNYARAKRMEGISKYPLWKMAMFAWDGITSHSTVPLTFVLICGLLVFLISFISLLAILAMRLAGRSIPAGVLDGLLGYLVTGINLLCLGLVGQYVGRIYQEVKRRPRFIIEQRLP
ncbi:MAG TPA: glycosyltransferase family 2 protein [Armatimonadota bacterium]|nr:glycosyltransferase family 2 protein [Armatimonadota bacterium]